LVFMMIVSYDNIIMCQGATMSWHMLLNLSAAW
jgi:hypothetical protein